MKIFLLKMNSYPPKSGNKTSQLSSISKENNEEGTSAGFVKVSAEIMRHFPKVEPRKLGKESIEKAGSIQTHHGRLKLKTREIKRVKENIQRKKKHLR